MESGWPIEYILEMPYSRFAECILSQLDPPKPASTDRDVEAELERLKRLNYTN